MCFTIFINKSWSKKRTAHFSVDDTIWLFENLGHFRYDSAFEQPTLNFFRKMHETFGIAVSFYCFGSFQGLHLADMTDDYRKEFEANNSWLRFGFHAANDSSWYYNCEPKRAQADYAAVMGELMRIVGEGALDHFPRLHDFSGSRECLAAMAVEGLRGVFCASNDNRNYYLDSNQNAKMIGKGIWIDKGIPLGFQKTDIQIEKIDNISEAINALAGKRCWEAFTHEWALNKENMKKIEHLFQWAQGQGYRFGFSKL